MISIVYAQPIGGRREFRFAFGVDAANHVHRNRSDLFRGVPELGPNYTRDMDRLRDRGWSLNWLAQDKLERAEAAKNGQ